METFPMPLIIRINVVRDGYPTKNNSQIQCNPDHNSRAILHRHTKNVKIHRKAQNTKDSQSNAEQMNPVERNFIPDLVLL